jgi:dCMP deaminase
MISMDQTKKTENKPDVSNHIRPSWDEYFLNITKDVAERSTCLSVKTAAIIVKDKRVLSTGYVGAPRKTKDCLERGNCLRRELNIPSGHRYELCRSVHAEQNAVINAARVGVTIEGADMYIFGKRIYNGDNTLMDMHPCFICKKIIINSGIDRVICSTKEGGLKIFNVSDWTEDWKNRDMIDDMEVYGVKIDLKK